MKWYAAYTGVGEYELLSEKEYKSVKHEASEGDDCSVRRVEYLRGHLQEFNTFREAKAHIRDHIKGDMGDLQAALFSLSRERAK